MFALLGDIQFQVIDSPQMLESVRRFDYAEHRVIESTPRLQWIGAELETIALTMLFHASVTNPSAQLAALLAAGADHQARALVLGNGVVRGFFVVVSVATSAIQLAADATPIAIRARTVLREWVAGAELDPAAPPIPAFVPLGLAPVAVAYTSPVAAGAAAAAYLEPTFNQPGVSPLVENPLPTGAPGTSLSFADVPAGSIVRAPQ